MTRRFTFSSILAAAACLVSIALARSRETVSVIMHALEGFADMAAAAISQKPSVNAFAGFSGKMDFGALDQSPFLAEMRHEAGMPRRAADRHR